MTTAVETLIAKYNKQWNKYGMGSVIAYSQVVADLEKLKEMEKEQMIEFACQVAEASAMKYIQGKTTRMIAQELIKQQEQ
jgi:hypothetical protein